MKRRHDKFPNALDLHGLTESQAISKTLMFLKLHKMNGTVWCKVITGASGKFYSNFRSWTEMYAMKPLVKNVHKGHETGAYLVRVN